MEFDSFVLAASTADLADEPRARAHADAVEFRMDAADDPLDALGAYDGELPVIATNRAEWEGGHAADDGRMDALAAAAEEPAVEAVDVELRSLRNDDGGKAARRAREAGASVVASVHDFERTPPEAELRDLLAEATERGDVGKLAVTAEGPDDVLSLLTVTREFAADDVPVATMAMGDAGRHSRAVAPVYGSKIGYAPVDPARATAPGQYDLATLDDLVARLR